MSDEKTNWNATTFDNAAIAYGLTRAGTNGDRYFDDASRLSAKFKKFCGMTVPELEHEVELALGHPPTMRELINAACAFRYGYKMKALRDYRFGRKRIGPERETFFADLKKFGRAKFDAKSRPIESSLDRGPDIFQYLRETAAGKS